MAIFDVPVILSAANSRHIIIINTYYQAGLVGRATKHGMIVTVDGRNGSGAPIIVRVSTSFDGLVLFLLFFLSRPIYDVDLSKPEAHAESLFLNNATVDLSSAFQRRNLHFGCDMAKNMASTNQSLIGGLQLILVENYVYLFGNIK